MTHTPTFNSVPEESNVFSSICSNCNNDPRCPWSHLFCSSTCCYNVQWDVHCHSNAAPTSARWSVVSPQVSLSFFVLLSLLFFLTFRLICFLPVFSSTLFSPSHTHTLTHSELYLLSCALEWPTYSLSLMHTHIHTDKALAPDCFNRWIGEFSS